MFKEYFLDVLMKHYADFSGRATRKQYWMWVLCLSITYFIVSFILNFISVFAIWAQLSFSRQINNIMNFIDVLFYIVTLIPYIAIQARRFRDAGISMILFVIILVIGIIGVGLLIFAMPRFYSVSLIMGSSMVSFIICLLPSKPLPYKEM